jgi:hypothetical protein
MKFVQCHVVRTDPWSGASEFAWVPTVQAMVGAKIDITRGEKTYQVEISSIDRASEIDGWQMAYAPWPETRSR